MSALFIFLHIASAILFLGPIMVVVSQFPSAALKARNGDLRADGAATNLYGVTRVYGWLSLLVPVFGLILMITDWSTYSSHYNLHAAIVLAAAAWIILLAVVVPKQGKMVAGLSAVNDGKAQPEKDTIADWGKAKTQLTIFSGVFNLLWIIVLVLMFL